MGKSGGVGGQHPFCALTMDQDGAWEVEFYLKGVATITVATFGILGNLISIRVASVGSLGWNPTFARLLIWLALLDSLFLVCVILLFGLPTVSTEFSNKILPVLFPSLLPVASIMLTASVYTVVCISIERLLHLRRPQWSDKGALMGYILPVLAFSTFYNFPKFFEFTTIYPQNGPAYPEATEFRRNSDYSLYVLTINCVVMGLLPFSLLIGINLSIARYFNRKSAGTDMRESSMKGLLLAIVVVQLVCHAPRTGLNIYEMVMAPQSHWARPGWSTSPTSSSSSPPPATSSSTPSRMQSLEIFSCPTSRRLLCSITEGEKLKADRSLPSPCWHRQAKKSEISQMKTIIRESMDGLQRYGQLNQFLIEARPLQRDDENYYVIQIKHVYLE